MAQARVPSVLYFATKIVELLWSDCVIVVSPKATVASGVDIALNAGSSAARGVPTIRALTLRKTALVFDHIIAENDGNIKIKK